MSCTQQLYSYMNRSCSLWLVYVYAVCLLLINTMGIWIDFRFISISRKFPFLTDKSIPMKQRFVHSMFYHTMASCQNIGITINVLIRFLRFITGIYIPVYLDNLTFYLIFYCFMWGTIFLIQLVLYIGYFFNCFYINDKRHCHIHIFHPYVLHSIICNCL